MKKAILILLALTLHSMAARAIELSWSGGNNSPVTLTLEQPTTYTITSATANGAAPFFAIELADNLLGSEFNASGSLIYTINSGTNSTFTRIGSGINSGSLTSGDLYFYGNTRPALNVGDVVTLVSGSLTTANNVPNPAPPSGNYSSFIFSNASGYPQVSGLDTAVPEPSTWALLSASSLGLLYAARHSRRSARA